MFQELFFLKEEEIWLSWVQLYTGIMENSSYRWTPCKNIWGKSVRDLQRQASPAMTKKPLAFVPVKDNFKRFTYIQNMTQTFDSQPAASTDPSMPSLAVANRSCPRKNTFALSLLVMFSLNTFPASRNNSRIFSAREAVPIFYNLLSIFFPLIFPITFWTQYSAAMVFHTRTPTAKLHTTKRHVLCFEFITFNFIWCSPVLVWEKAGTGHSPLSLISVNAFWKFKTTASHVFFMHRFDDSFKAPGLGSQSERKTVHISILSELFKYTRFITVQSEKRNVKLLASCRCHSKQWKSPLSIKCALISRLF